MGGSGEVQGRCPGASHAAGDLLHRGDRLGQRRAGPGVLLQQRDHGREQSARATNIKIAQPYRAAALILAQAGFKPLIIERGKVVRERTKDTFGLWRQHKLNPESNVQFGEGGAGTFSDGKLWTQVSDPKHYGRKVLQEFVKADAPPEIMYVSKPHIGTFRLVSMVEKMRADMTDGHRSWRDAPSGRGAVIETVTHDGWIVEQVRADLARLAHPAQGVRNAIAQVARELQKEGMSPGIGEGLPPGAAAAAGQGPHRQGLAARHI